MLQSVLKSRVIFKASSPPTVHCAAASEDYLDPSDPLWTLITRDQERDGSATSVGLCRRRQERRGVDGVKTESGPKGAKHRNLMRDAATLTLQRHDSNLQVSTGCARLHISG